MLFVLNSLKQVQNLQDKFWITAFIDNKIASFHTTSSSTNLVFYLLVLVIHVVPKNRDIQHAPAQTSWKVEMFCQSSIIFHLVRLAWKILLLLWVRWAIGLQWLFLRISFLGCIHLFLGYFFFFSSLLNWFWCKIPFSILTFIKLTSACSHRY